MTREVILFFEENLPSSLHSTTFSPTLRSLGQNPFPSRTSTEAQNQLKPGPVEHDGSPAKK